MDVPIARVNQVNQHTFECPIICAIVCDNTTYNQNLFFVSIHFCANFPTTNGKKFQKLRLLSNLSDHIQRFKEENGNTILLQIYNAAHKPICNLQRHMKCLWERCTKCNPPQGNKYKLKQERKHELSHRRPALPPGTAPVQLP